MLSDVFAWPAVTHAPAGALRVSPVDGLGQPAARPANAHVDQIVETLDALGVLIGALIGVSEIKARLTA